MQSALLDFEVDEAGLVVKGDRHADPTRVSVPDELVERLRTLAQAQQRSLDAQIVVLLDWALQVEESRFTQAEILKDARRFRPPPDIVTLLRQDRV